jgi:6-phosphofructokinase 2
VIVTVTMNPALDVVTEVPRVVPAGKLRCGAPRRAPGGGGVNVARTIAALGGHPVALYARGGLVGGRLDQALAAVEGLTARPVHVRGETRENLLVRETTTGHELHLVMPGPRVGATEWGAVLRALETMQPAPGYVVASGSLPRGVPEDFYGRLAERVRAAGGRMVLDTRGEPLRRALDRGVWMIKPNVGELAELVGEHLPDERALETAATGLVAAGACEVVVLSLGRGGAVLVSRDHGAVHLRSPVVRQASRVGAGDAMVGGTVLALARGAPLRDAVEAGIVAGAATVMTPAFTTCNRRDVDELTAQLHERLDVPEPAIARGA